MVEKRGRLGRKNRKGFYDYPEKGPKKLWPGLAELQGKTLSPTRSTQSGCAGDQGPAAGDPGAGDRAHLRGGLLTDVREADVGSILGFGFAPFKGGTLSYIDMMGTKNFVELCKRLQKKYGARFKPSKLITDMAAKGETFYGRFAPQKQKAAA